jgi:hypothetical protein
MKRHVYAIQPIIKISLIVDVPPELNGSGDQEEGFSTLQWRGKHTLLSSAAGGQGRPDMAPRCFPRKRSSLRRTVLILMPLFSTGIRLLVKPPARTGRNSLLQKRALRENFVNKAKVFRCF